MTQTYALVAFNEDKNRYEVWKHFQTLEDVADFSGRLPMMFVGPSVFKSQDLMKSWAYHSDHLWNTFEHLPYSENIVKDARGEVVYRPVSRNPLTRIKRKEIRTKPSQATGHAAPSERLIKRRNKTAAMPVPGIFANPLTRVEIMGESQRAHLGTNGKPTKRPNARLVQRREYTEAMPEGFYANPLTAAQQAKFKTVYSVHKKGQPAHMAIAYFTKKSDAVETAREAANRTGVALVVSSVDQYIGDTGNANSDDESKRRGGHW